MTHDCRRRGSREDRDNGSDEGGLRVLSLHWGCSPGGVAKYAVSLGQLAGFAPITVRHVVIYDPAWQLDRSALDRLDPVHITIKSRGDWSWLRRFGREVKRFQPHLLLTFGFNGNVIVWIYSVLRGPCAPCVSAFHGAYYAPSRGRRMLAPVLNALSEAFLRRRAASIASVSEVSKSYLVERGVPADKIVVIHNGLRDRPVNPTARHAARRALGLLENDLAVGLASRLDPIKGVPFLFEAIFDLFATFPELKLIVIGTGPLEEVLKRQVANSGYQDRVRFTGFRNDVEQLLDGLDIFALPSLQENHSIGLLEAMRAGRAIVATAVGGNPESVRDGREALVVPPADANALRDALRQLAADPQLRERLGAAARRRFLARFTADRMLEQTAAWLLSSARTALRRGDERLASPCGS